MQATIDVTATVGFAAMTVADIAATAQIGRRTFSWYFADKLAAFEVGYREITQELRLEVQAAFDSASTPVDRIRACLGAVADFLAEDPARAEVLLIEGHSAGPAIVEIRAETMRRLVQLLIETTNELPSPGGDRQVVAETLAGGLHEIAYSRTLRGEVHLLPILAPELVQTVLAAYLGLEGAQAVVGADGSPVAAGGEREPRLAGGSSRAGRLESRGGG